MSEHPSSDWLEMAVDVVRASRKHWSTDEYTRFSKISEPLPGRGYFDRMKVLNRLIEDGVVYLKGRQIMFRGLENVDWVKRGLISGSKTIWDFVEATEPTENFSRKFENDHLIEIGRTGEAAVIDRLLKVLPAEQCNRVLHVSLTNDAAGYDIFAPSTVDSSNELLLEVKTSVRPGENFAFYLSRNEYRVGSQNPNWYLIFVRVVDSVPEILGYVKANSFQAWLPTEHDDRSKWQSVLINMDVKGMSPDLP